MHKQSTPTELKAYYAIRRTLVPWRFEEGLTELIEYCHEIEINEVILKIDVEEFSHGMPTVAWVQEYQKYLFRAKEKLNAINVQYSLNPWITLGHFDRGRRSDMVHPGIDWFVGHDGVRCTAQACPLSDGWRNLFKKLWTLYAQTKPHVIWVEDDIRTFNHAPAVAGCFCDNHMSLFSERVGETVKREQLVECITKPGKPHPWRSIWLDIQGDIMVDTAHFIEQVVHTVSPETKLGLMSSGPANHAGEGRKWQQFAEALRGNQNQILYSRPPLWTYVELSLRGLYSASDMIMHTRAVMPASNIAELTEIDNYPFTSFSKSNAYTFLQMAISAALGCEGFTLNLYDHCGSPMSIDPEIKEMLSNSRPFINAITDACRNKNGIKGVQLLTCEQASYYKELKAGDNFLRIRPDGYAWQSPLNAFGIPTTYQNSSLVAVSGQLLRQYDDNCLKSLLGKGLLLDGQAAAVLQERGLGEHLGLHIHRLYPARTDKQIAAEEFFDNDFGGKAKTFATISPPDTGDSPLMMAHIEPSGNGRVLSRLVDPDCNVVYPMMHIYENTLGGRVAVWPYDLESELGTGFFHPYRRKLLLNVLNWLNKGSLDSYITAQSYVLPIHMDTTNSETILGCFNLCLDEYSKVRFTLNLRGKTFQNIQCLTRQGTWINLPETCVTTSRDIIEVEYNKPVSFKTPLFIKFTW